MPIPSANRRRAIRQRYRRCPIDAPMYVENEIETLSDFFAVFHSLLDSNKTFWFRGHPQVGYRLAPSALRYNEEEDRALELVADMKRFLEPKLPRPPASDDDLGWMQVAQHYGLPTRLLRLQARGRILKVKTSGHRPPLTPPIRLNSQNPGRVLGHLTPNCGRPVAARPEIRTHLVAFGPETSRRRDRLLQAAWRPIFRSVS